MESLGFCALGEFYYCVVEVEHGVGDIGFS